MKKTYFILVLLFAIFIMYSNKGYSQIRIPYGNDWILEIDSTNLDPRYELHGNSWDCRYVSYFFVNGTTDLPGTEEQDAVRLAFDTWSAVMKIDFIEACNENDADIRIEWATGDHGDGAPFDDGGTCTPEGFINILAHAYFPPPNAGDLAGDLHFDDWEVWRNNGLDIDLETVALHELGHSLGLLHSDVEGSVMFAEYGGVRRDLTTDDIEGIRTKYGHNTNPVTTNSDYLCNGTNATFTLDDYDCINPNFTIMWQVSSGLSVASGQGTGTLVVTGNSQNNGLETVTVTINSGCDQLVYSEDIWIGKPSFEMISDPLVCVGDLNKAFIIPHSPYSHVQWTSTGVVQILSQGSEMTYRATATGYGLLCAEVFNLCGSETWCNFVHAVDRGCGDGIFERSFYFDITPNPSSSVINIEIPLEFQNNEVKSLKIVNQFGNIIEDTQFALNNHQINVSLYQPGIYYVSITTIGLISTNKLIIN